LQERESELDKVITDIDEVQTEFDRLSAAIAGRANRLDAKQLEHTREQSVLQVRVGLALLYREECLKGETGHDSTAARNRRVSGTIRKVLD
jgi:hypothetical protein